MADNIPPVLTRKEDTLSIQKSIGQLNDTVEMLSDNMKKTVSNEDKKQDGGFLSKKWEEMQDTFGNISGFLMPKRLSPKRNVMLKQSPESVYLADAITGKMEEQEDDEKKKGILGNLFSALMGGLAGTKLGKMASTLFPQIMKALPFAALAGGIIWMVIDGIKGFFLSGEWGVRGISGVIGSVLGGTDKGLKGGFKNMGKWALIGAGIGSFVPVIGTLVGGLIGAAVGFLLGWIGGERIAKLIDKGIDKLTDFVESDFVKGLVTGVQDFFQGFLSGGLESFRDSFNFSGIWSSDRSFISKVFDSLQNIGGSLLNFVIDGLRGGFDAILGQGNAISEALDIVRDFIQPVMDLIISVPRDLLNGIVSRFRGREIWQDEDASFGEKLGMSISNIAEMLIGGVMDMFKGLGENAINLFRTVFMGEDSLLRRTQNLTGEMNLRERLFNAVGMMGEAIWNAIKGIFGFIGDMLSGIWQGADAATGGKLTEVVNWFDETVIGGVRNFFTTVGNTISNIWEGATTFIEDKMITPIKNIFAGITNMLGDIRLWVMEQVARIPGTGANRRQIIAGREMLSSLGLETSGMQLDIAELVQERMGLGNLQEAFKEIAGMNESQLRNLKDEIETVEDAIIKPDGTIIRTDPEDTLIAAKGSLGSSEVEQQMLMVLQNIEAKTGAGNKGAAIVNNNMMDRYNPQLFIRRLRAGEVL